MVNAFVLMVQFFGGGLVLDAVPIAANGIVSRRWPTASGRILSSEVSSSVTVGGGEGGPQQPVSDPVVSYEYEVQGQRYTASRVSFQGTWPTLDVAIEVVVRYPAGTSVTVWYDSEDPESAVLEPGAGLFPYFQMLMGFLIIGIGMLFQLNPSAF
jgi:hypothetical protein